LEVGTVPIVHALNASIGTSLVTYANQVYWGGNPYRLYTLLIGNP